jgi:N-acetyl-1-D-myo-inositol-2-amino-2-deoxy-alpha-D-glucopyranoside deacetylase
MSDGGLLCLYAHPDDEQLGTGTSCLLARRDIPVTVLSATRGDAGEISDPALATRETLGAVRTRELEQACAIAGLQPPILLDYRDGRLGQADPAELRDALVGLIRRLRPRVVVTFDPLGGYGHPDHIAVHKAAVAAATIAADADYRPQLGGAHAVDKLYFSAFPRSRVAYLNDALAALGMAPLGFGDVQTIDSSQIGTPDELVTTVVDVAAVYDRRIASQRAHRTQFGPESLSERLPDEIGRRLWATDCFVRVQPSPNPSATLPDETDLWSGLPGPILEAGP